MSSNNNNNNNNYKQQQEESNEQVLSELMNDTPPGSPSTSLNSSHNNNNNNNENFESQTSIKESLFPTSNTQQQQQHQQDLNNSDLSDGELEFQDAVSHSFRDSERAQQRYAEMSSNMMMMSPQRETLMSDITSTTGHVPRSSVGAGEGMTSTAGDGLTSVGPTSEVWGTNINTSETSAKCFAFIEKFKKHPEDPESFYITELQELEMSDSVVLNVNCADLRRFDLTLYEQLVCYPADVIPIMDFAVNYIFNSRFRQPGEGGPEGETSSRARIQVRTYNLLDMKHMRDLEPIDIEKMISIRGMISRVGSIQPELKQGFFRCSICGSSVTRIVERGRIEEPKRCGHCGAELGMELVHNRCLFTDKQIVKLQETPDSIPEGETPHTVTLVVFDSLVDAVKPGDRVDVTGIYKAVPMRLSSKVRTVKSIYKTYIDVIHFKKTSSNKTDEDSVLTSMEEDPVSKMTENEIQELRDLASRRDIYDLLVRSIAPSIYEMDDVKRGILCQLFGGTNKKFPNGKIRGEINILLVGDPGVSKSQLLQYVHKISPRGIYTSGKGSSAVGLTAYIVKDTETRELVLESGALVLSDKGICCIDEFDKMSDATRSILHEVMEQQTVSVAKAGIICSLNARTSILAAANPIESRYNDNLSIVENIQLPPTLLSRFDLIYLLRDKSNEQLDRRLARHIVSLYYDDENDENNNNNNNNNNRNNASNSKPKNEQERIDIGTLKKFIAYAKRYIHPTITEEAKERLIDGYTALRHLGMGKDKISATPRQLESLIRLAEAMARMRFSTEVTKEDVAEAVRLMRSAIYKAIVDPRSGTIDIDLLTTGMSAEQRETEQRNLLEDDEDQQSNIAMNGNSQTLSQEI